jgi:hypothetical protein
MPKNLKLGPWISSKIDKSIPLKNLYSCPSAQEYADYLKSFSSHKKIDIRSNSSIQKITRLKKEFVLELRNSKPIRSNILIVATGYFSNPVIPKWCQKINDTVKIYHYSEYNNLASYLEGKTNLNILIVGGRVSAGEILSSIDLNTHNISLSSRHQINFENPIWLQLLFSPLYYLIEKYNPKSQKKGSSVRNMAGGKTKKMFNKGLINNVGPVLGVEGNSIAFNHSHKIFDVIILATGWKPSLSFLPNDLLSKSGEPLCHDMQSTIWSNLFFIGFDNLISYRSRFLRGIRDDAIELAKIIKNTTIFGQ